jgi:hypothetical protein
MNPRPSCLRVLLLLTVSAAASAQTTIVWTNGTGNNNWNHTHNWSPNLLPVHGHNARITDASPMGFAIFSTIIANSLWMDSAPASGVTPNVFTVRTAPGASSFFRFDDPADPLRVHAGTLILQGPTTTLTLTATHITVASRSGLARERATLELDGFTGSTISTIAIGDGANAAGLNVRNSTLSVSGAFTAAALSELTLTDSLLSVDSLPLAGSLTLANSVVHTASGLTLAAGGSLQGYGVLIGPVTDSGGSFGLSTPTGTLDFSRTLNVGTATATVYSLGTPVFNGAVNVSAGGAIVSPSFHLGPAAVLTTGASLNNRISGAAGSQIAVTGNVTLGDASAADGFSTAGTLTVGSRTVTLASAGVADLGVTSLGAGLTGGVLVTPAAGIRLQTGDSLTGFGFIRGPVLDQTGGAAIAPAGVSYAGSLAVGADPVQLLGSAVISGALSLAGGSLTSLSTVFDHSQLSVGSISGHGTVAARITLNGTGGTLLSLDGDLALDGTGYAPPSLPAGKTYAVGAHTLSLPAGAIINGTGTANFELAGGRVTAGGSGLPVDAGRIELSGAGLLLNATAQHFRPGTVVLHPSSALVLSDHLAVGAQLAVFASTAPVQLGPQTTLAGGMLYSPHGFTLEGTGAITGHGLIQGLVTDNTGGAGGVFASGTFDGGATIFGLGGGTTRVLSAGQASFTFTDAGRTAPLTLVAPAGVSLLRDTTLGLSSQPLTVQGDLVWRGGDLTGPLHVTGNLSGQNLRLDGAVTVGGVFAGSGLFGDFSAAGVAASGSVTMPAFVQSAGANTRLVAGGLTVTAHDVTLDGGTFTADHGLRFAAGTALRGHGVFTGYAAGGAGDIEGVSGHLTVDARGAGGTVAFDRIVNLTAGATVSIQADNTVTVAELVSDAGTGFSTSHGAQIGSGVLGWGWVSGPPVVLQGAANFSHFVALSPLDTGSLRIVNGDSVYGGLNHDTLVRGTAVLAAENGALTVGSGGAVTLAATDGVEVPAGGSLHFHSSQARIVGALQVDGSVSGSALQVAGLITGSGLFHQSVALLGATEVQDYGGALFLGIASGGLNPGAVGGSGLLAFGQNLTLAGNSTLTFELGGATRGASYDAIDVGGVLDFGGATLEINFFGSFVPQAGENFQLFSYSTATGAFTAVHLPALPNGLVWDTSFLLTGGTLGVTAIPEPSAYAAGAGLGALLLAWLRRRRRPSRPGAGLTLLP